MRMTSEPNKPKIYISELTVKTHFCLFFAIVSILCCLPAIRPADLSVRHAHLPFCKERAKGLAKQRRVHRILVFTLLGGAVPKSRN